MFLRFLNVFLLFVLTGIPVLAQKDVLIICSYHGDYQWSREMIDGISGRIRESFPEVELYAEFLDTKRFPVEEYLDVFRIKAELLRSKYSKRPPDVLLLLDDNALSFYRHFGRDLFEDTPAVCCGINNSSESALRDSGVHAGVKETIAPGETVRWALEAFPGRRAVYVLTDQSTTAGLNLKTVEAALNDAEGLDRYEVVSTVDFGDLAALGRFLAALPSDAIIYYNEVFSVGARYLTQGVILESISAACSAPIIASYDFYLGHGVIGGRMTSGAHQGRRAAEIAAEILAGNREAAERVEIASPNAWIFDAAQLRRFGLDASFLPPGSEIVNRPYSVFIEYKWEILGAAAVIVLLAALSVGLGVNIRRRIRTEQELRVAMKAAQVANAAKDDFLAVMSHELRTPINPIMGFLSIMKDEPQLVSYWREIRVMEKASVRLLHMIDSVLTYSRIQKNGLAVEQRAFDFVRSAQKLVEASRSKYTRNHYTLSFEPGQDSGAWLEIVSNRELLLGVVEELLSNASANTDRGAIELSCCLLEGKGKQATLVCSVRDEGKGIPRDRLGAIFDPFYQVDSSFSRPTEGAGLGLAICRRSVELLGGAIEVESELGAGSTFTFRVPVGVREKRGERACV